MTELGEDLASLLSAEDLLPNARRGDLLQGTVIATDAIGLIVDLGMKRDGVIPRSDYEKLPDREVNLCIGDAVSVMVIDPIDPDGNLIVSIAQARESGDWLEARRKMDDEEVIEATPTSLNKGGLIVPFGRLSAFVPASHISELPRGLDEDGRIAALKELVGKPLPFRVIEVDPQRRRLVFSERKAIRQYRQQQKADVIQTLKEGEIRSGIVTSLREFGAFVDIGGADGLIHISELAWTRIEDPSEVLQINQEVETLIIRLDPESNRIGLSLKRLEPNPWKEHAERIKIGQELNGEVSVLTSTGAFIRVADKLEGLMKFSDGPGNLMPGAEVRVKVVDFDSEKERMDLALVEN
ncbi:MAG: S1 RNA-binding domain-containing protein [Anaerolineales bacterium]|nr:MAG: S1 RNA-binding domain-containing protein [Anaerolineales bacterium]